ncbi:MAG: queuosine precursor transporter [Bacteroidota bacterium]
MATSAFVDQLRTGAPSRSERLYLLLAGIFLGALVMTNAIAGKFFVLFGQELSCGIIAYPVTFLATDLISELYGRERATLVVKVGFAVSVFVTVVVWLANMAPIFDQSPVDQDSFNRVFGLLPGIVFGSMVAYLTAQFVDVQFFEFWRELTDGKHLWLRNNASTVVSQMVDTVLVVTIALVIWPNVDNNDGTTAISWSVWWGIIVGQYLFKAAIALIDTPLFYLLTAKCSAWLAADPAHALAEAEA